MTDETKERRDRTDLVMYREIQKNENEEKDMLERIADHYGYDSQRVKCIEELGELITALAKDDKDSITEEIADVEIMLVQIKHLLKLHVMTTKKRKIDRQLDRIRIEKANIASCIKRM